MHISCVLHTCVCMFMCMCVQEGPAEAAVAALGEATETPERLWTAAMRGNTAEEVAHLALQAHAAQVIPLLQPLLQLLGCVSSGFSHAVPVYTSRQSPSVTTSAALLACPTQNWLLPWLYTCAMSYW